MRSLVQLFVLSVALLASPFCLSGPVDQHRAPRPPALNVLFIGNSYTYVNNLPDMVTTMSNANESPRGIQTKMIAVSAATLQKLWDEGLAMRAIKNERWDFVVLQEQSVLPTVHPDRMEAYAKRFDEVIRQNGARTILFVTWARKGKPEMQEQLNAAYRHLAKELHALIAPVGPAWQIALNTKPSVQLHMEDGSHPSPLGTYLAACTFYRTILDGVESCPPPTSMQISAEDLALVRASSARAISEQH